MSQKTTLPFLPLPSEPHSGKVKSASIQWPSLRGWGCAGATGYKEMDTKLSALREPSGEGDPIYINSTPGSIIHGKNK